MSLLDYWVTPRLAAGYPSNLFSLCVLRARTSLSDLFLIAPRPQRSQREIVSYFSELGALCAFALAPWNILSTEALSFHSRHYFTGRVPWNTDSTKIELFALRVIPQGRSSFIRFPKPKFNGKFHLWTVFVYHEAHEDHEESTIKLYRPLRFKLCGRYNLITHRPIHHR